MKSRNEEINNIIMDNLSKYLTLPTCWRDKICSTQINQVERSSSLATILSLASVAALQHGRVLVVFGLTEVGPMLPVVDPLQALSNPL